MSYWTYENRKGSNVKSPTKGKARTVIHRDACLTFKQHGGVQNHNQGGWVQHATYAAAKSHAVATKLIVHDCLKCNPL